MVQREALQAVDILSCVLSMIGSSLVALTWAYPLENRKRHGRILLLWLSISDFFAALIYFAQEFTGPESCEALALIGIFFPVASFLWTDCIAYYIYLVVCQRLAATTDYFNFLLRMFHIIVWSLSGLIVLFVGVFGHAGSNNDDADYDNTGGWCWVKGGDSTDVFLWELIGGKFVEWVSFLILVPFLYISVARKLYAMEQRLSHYGGTGTPTTTGIHIKMDTSEQDLSENRQYIESETQNNVLSDSSVAEHLNSSVASYHHPHYTTAVTDHHTTNRTLDSSIMSTSQANESLHYEVEPPEPYVRNTLLSENAGGNNIRMQSFDSNPKETGTTVSAAAVYSANNTNTMHRSKDSLETAEEGTFTNNPLLSQQRTAAQDEQRSTSNTSQPRPFPPPPPPQQQQQQHHHHTYSTHTTTNANIPQHAMTNGNHNNHTIAYANHYHHHHTTYSTQQQCPVVFFFPI